MNDLDTNLTADEASLLAQCEDVISRGLRTFIETGNALADVRDNRLYRINFPTFEDYCADRWQISRPRAYELIAAAAVVSGIPDTLPQPSSAQQALELAKVPEAERADVWGETVERTAGKPTAAAVKEVREERAAPVEPAARVYPSSPPAQGRIRPIDRPTFPTPAPANPGTADDDSMQSDPLPLPGITDQVPSPAKGAPSDNPEVINEDEARRSSVQFASSLAALWMILDPNPVGWIDKRYRPDAYRDRVFPRVRDVFTVDGLRTLSDHLNDIADHIESKGATL